jgi:hypothetical protein
VVIFNKNILTLLGERALRRLRSRCKYNIQMDHRAIKCKGMKWVLLVQSGFQR